MSGTDPIRTDGDGVEDVDEDVDIDAIAHPYDPAKTKIDSVQTNLDTLIKRLEHDEIDKQPSFQRAAGLWDPGKMSRLIESMLIRIPLPAFYFDGTNDDKWLVVDGLQRLSTLQRFVLETDPSIRLYLTGLEYLHHLHGLSYEKLPRSMQRRIEETQITMHIIRPGTPPEVKYNIFRRINTGGLVLTAQEIRHALNPGPALAFLDKLAKSDAFLRATGWSIPSERMVDREFVLRFFAFIPIIQPILEEKSALGSLDRLLTRTLANLNQAKDLEHREEMFTHAMEAAQRIFGNDAFRKRFAKGERRHPINKALFDAWSMHFVLLEKGQIDTLAAHRERVQEEQMALMNEDQTFLDAISQGTGDTAKIRYRFAAIGKIISGILASEDDDAS